MSLEGSSLQGPKYPFKENDATTEFQMVYFCLTGQNAPPLSLPFSSPLPNPQGTRRFNATKPNFPAQTSRSEVDAHDRVQLVLGY